VHSSRGVDVAVSSAYLFADPEKGQGRIRKEK